MRRFIVVWLVWGIVCPLASAFNFENYPNLKTRGIITLSKPGGVVTITFKRFDEETGEALPDRVERVSVSEIQVLRAERQAETIALQQFIADVQVLP